MLSERSKMCKALRRQLGEKEAQAVSWFEAKLKGQSEPLEYGWSTRPQECGSTFTVFATYTDTSFYTSATLISYTVDIPKPLSANGTVNLVVETVQRTPLILGLRRLGRKIEQSLKYEGDLLVLSPYKTATQRIKFRCV